jgi:murein DD-endopeptidase MepM/ murein hydrolase activator NlpD
MIKCFLLTLALLYSPDSRTGYYLPINTTDRLSIHSISLTSIGGFGVLRKERPGVPSHFHTGIDIKRPTGNYQDEPIFPIFDGIVISIRKDGPYAQIIIEHGSSHKFWTVYEHVAGINVRLSEQVTPDLPIARFMNKNELNKYGWQFDHFHFEILKVKPLILKTDDSNPERRYSSYSLTCSSMEELNKYFYNPIEFLKTRLH